jgi:hypothetical protein
MHTQIVAKRLTLQFLFFFRNFSCYFAQLPEKSEEKRTRDYFPFALLLLLNNNNAEETDSAKMLEKNSGGKNERINFHHISKLKMCNKNSLPFLLRLWV